MSARSELIPLELLFGNPERVTDWQSRLETLIEEHRVPGATLGILADGQITAYAAGESAEL